MSNRAHGERGAVMLMVTFSLIAFFGFAALALDLGRMYIIKGQLQNAADAGALRAAKALDGTAGGMTGATVKGKESAQKNRLFMANLVVDEPQFASTPFPANWATADAACRAAPKGCRFARVDTSAQGIASFFAGIIGVSTNAARALAVAGLYKMRVTPGAMCAIDYTDCPGATGVCAHPPCLGMCGYTPGKAYMMSEVNPVGPGTPLWINPLATTRDECMSNGLGSSDAMRPYVCKDGMVSPVVTVSDFVYTNTGLSLGPLYGALDSRFGDYPSQSQCDEATAPPDVNIREFQRMQTGSTASPWMNEVPTKQTATTVKTTADPTILTADNAGVVWAFTRHDALNAAIPARAAVPPEPNPYPGISSVLGTRTPRTTAAPANRYPAAGTGTAGAGTPYAQTSGSYFLAPTGRGAPFRMAERRVLNMLIVQCSPDGGVCRPAEKKMIGRFFMQTRASTEQEVYLEFGGLTTLRELKTEIRLYR